MNPNLYHCYLCTTTFCIYFFNNVRLSYYKGKTPSCYTLSLVFFTLELCCEYKYILLTIMPSLVWSLELLQLLRKMVDRNKDPQAKNSPESVYRDMQFELCCGNMQWELCCGLAVHISKIVRVFVMFFVPYLIPLYIFVMQQMWHRLCPYSSRMQEKCY